MTTSRWLAACTLALPMASLSIAADPPRGPQAWAAGPMETRIAFPEAVDPSVASGVVGTKIGFEDPAAQGRPGGNRGTLRVAAARLEDGGRTLVLATDPHPREATYRLSLPGVKAAGKPGEGERVEVAYDLSGVEATWHLGAAPPPGAGGGPPPAWSGWLPTFDMAEAYDTTRASAGHERLWAKIGGDAGRLTLRAFVNLPMGQGSLTFDASAPFRATLSGEEVRSFATPENAHRAALRFEGAGEAVELQVDLATGCSPSPRLRIATQAAGQDALTPLPRSSLVMPWAPPTPTVASPAEVPATLLTGGDPARGEAIFRGETAKCATCHAMRGQGPAIGPDLAGLAGADRSWVYQNIAEPSASIHPDYASYTVAFKDGRVVMGVVRAEGADSLRVSDIDAKSATFPTAEVEELRPSPSSIMPVGLLGAIGTEATRDLLAYLTAPAPASAPKPDAPR
ncbi:c-type cytochrome [Tundrisphaera sp. TA3]|uniref:c-type cytochrome n=1 Tax=Tundrisphaera sp. TA3 TaxID=3435775 RepID=UPI003EB90945